MNATRQELIDFLDDIRAYERESHNLVGFDERESSEFVDIYLKKVLPVLRKRQPDLPLLGRRIKIKSMRKDFQVKGRTFAINIPVGAEDPSVRSMMEEWVQRIQRQKPEPAGWTTLPQLPQYRFLNLRVENIDFPETRNDKDDGAEAQISISFTYDNVAPVEVRPKVYGIYSDEGLEELFWDEDEAGVKIKLEYEKDFPGHKFWVDEVKVN